MKKMALAISALALAVSIPLSAMANEPVTGFIFKEAVQAGGGSGSVNIHKTGCAECKSYFGIVALGNCSITQAMKNGKINNLSHYDEEIVNILGFKKITVKAYGQ